MHSQDVGAYWEANAENWTRFSRAGYDVYRDALNTPSFLSMLPPIDGRDGLDIGCGEGSNTRKLVECGARMQAIDIAPTFIRHAQEMEASSPLGVRFEIADGAALPFADASFDFATAFMSLMDMPDQPRALGEACRVLRPGGFLQFSILHPCFVPPHRKTLRDENGRAYAIEIAGYFDETPGRVETWWFSTLPRDERAQSEPFRVPRFHRTLSAWVRMIREAGFIIEAMEEPSASVEVAKAVPTVADTRVAGIFLIVRATKPTT